LVVFFVFSFFFFVFLLSRLPSIRHVYEHWILYEKRIYVLFKHHGKAFVFPILDFLCHGSGAVGLWMACASNRETFVSMFGAFARDWSWNTLRAESNWNSDGFTMHAILIIPTVVG
jgi:hypothetical protein